MPDLCGAGERRGAAVACRRPAVQNRDRSLSRSNTFASTRTLPVAHAAAKFSLPVLSLMRSSLCSVRRTWASARSTLRMSCRPPSRSCPAKVTPWSRIVQLTDRSRTDFSRRSASRSPSIMARSWNAFLHSSIVAIPVLSPRRGRPRPKSTLRRYRRGRRNSAPSKGGLARVARAGTGADTGRRTRAQSAGPARRHRAPPASRARRTLRPGARGAADGAERHRRCGGRLSVARRLRLDAELVRRGMARSRAQAASLIASGRVEVRGLKATKAATGVDGDTPVRVVEGTAREYVSRGGYKLAGALAALPGIEVAGRRRRSWLSTSATASWHGRCALIRGCALWIGRTFDP